MKKYSLIVLILFNFASFAQTNKIQIKYSIKNEKKLQYREKVIEGDTITGNGPSDKIRFKNKLNLNLYFIEDKLFLNNKLLCCFKNVQYYYSMLFIAPYNKEYIYIYPHHYGRMGPYEWQGLGVLIEVKAKPIVKENIDQFEDYEIDQLLKFKKYKIRNLKNQTCHDGSID